MEETKKDTQSRKWQLTINNPLDYGFSHASIIEAAESLGSIVYYCMCDETGENGTDHTHIYIACSSAVRFSRLKKLFPPAHIEPANGTSSQNRDYILKDGKWKNDRKSETNHSETFEEHGEMPIERQGARNDLADLYDMIKQGMTNYQIIEENQNFLFRVEQIERVRQVVTENLYKTTFRKLDVTYVFGDTGQGKTRSIMERYGYGNVYRITDYSHPFDGYAGESVIIFEEFRSSFKISDMLNYLDGYPLYLPARFSNKVACYTNVFITTNFMLEEQYKDVQRDYPSTFEAFLRRIHHVREYKDGSYVQYDDINSYMARPSHPGFTYKTYNIKQHESESVQLTIPDIPPEDLPFH